jgi:hypothetical protein
VAKKQRIKKQHASTGAMHQGKFFLDEHGIHTFNPERIANAMMMVLAKRMCDVA